MILRSAFLFTVVLALASVGLTQEDPAKEPSVVAVAKAMPAVVNVNTERVVKRMVSDPYDDFFNNFFGGPMRPPRQIRQKVQSLGSGFVVDPKGYIVTNEHVVERAAELKISVTTSDGKTYEARYVAGSKESDLALLKIETPEALPYIKLTDLSPSYLGQTVLVLGNPLGYGSSVARGILSAKNRTVAINETEYKGLIQTDAAINPGNSGGPVVDLAGKLVGVSSVKMAFTPQGVPTQGLGFAIPGEFVRTKVEEFKKIAANSKNRKPLVSVSIARKRFGLQLQDLTPALSETLGYEPGSGVLVADVDPHTPAAEAGITRGLVLYQVGRYGISSVKQVDELLEAVESGSVVDFTVGAIRQIRGQSVRQVQTVSLKPK